MSLLDRYPRFFDALAWAILFFGSAGMGILVAAWLSGGAA